MTELSDLLKPAFVSLEELEHVCYLLREQADLPPGLSEKDLWNCTEVTRILRRKVRTQWNMDAATSYAQGYKVPFDRTYIADDYRKVDAILENLERSPYDLARELHQLEVLLHRIFIFALSGDMVIAERTRKSALKEAVAEAKAGAFSETQSKNAGNPRVRAPSETAGKALVMAVRHASKKRQWNTAWDWLCEQAASMAKVGKFSLKCSSTDLGIVNYKGPDGKVKVIKRGTFRTYWSK